MIDTTKSLRESLDELGVAGSYVWKPKRFHVKYPDQYPGVDVDVVSDGSAGEVEAAVTEAKGIALTDIGNLSNEKKNTLHENENDYMNLFANVESRYQKLYNYFNSIRIPSAATIAATGIANLNNL